MPIKILAAGDIHLGLIVTGLSAGVGEFSARDIWKRMVDWAVLNNVDIVALSGDIVDRDNRFFEAVGPLQAGFRKLGENNIRVFIVSGNHDFDVLPQIIRSGSHDNVKLLGAGGTWELERYVKGSETLQFAGWSFPVQHVRNSPLKNFDITGIDPDLPCIGLLHADYGAVDSPYNPVSLPDFVRPGIDAWILGHIHKPQELNLSGPYIFYPGSPLALSSKETGAHGPVVITVNNNTAGRAERAFPSPVRFENISIDISGSGTEEALRDTLVNGLLDRTLSLGDELQDVSCISYGVMLTGTHANPALVESWASGMRDDFSHETADGTKIVVHDTDFNIQPEVSNLRELARQNSPAGMLARTIVAIEDGEETEFLKNLLAEWKTNHREMNRKEIYLSLQKSALTDDDAEKKGKQFILAESKRLLGNLLQQKSE
ncbi:MAG TPA: DNA repair exonuclease [Bacteroidales bacterium]|jgi:DNA repair exonuclease SbcCD nuclease subunit|nr:DNA repair exonuclease [Bacteroidales bacterium]HQH24648.1 DNA repair exonuclease [Bacteroidales bacterium]HQJ82915.1 DNA repair exonuclease [Bacteroidales bacterium]